MALPTTAELLGDWTLPVPLTLACVLTLAVYLRGFTLLRRTRPTLSRWRAVCFTAGIFVLWGALASPFEELADTVLTAHMIEHLVLMMAVPPLLLVGWPTVPLLRGIPGPSAAAARPVAAIGHAAQDRGPGSLAGGRVACDERHAAAVAHSRRL